MHVGFLPFIPKPITEYSTVYIHINAEFCGSGQPIVLDIYLQKKKEFCNIIPMLGGFHTAKCVKHCIGKCIQGSGIEESLRQTQVFGVNVVGAVLNDTNYARSLKGYLILANAIEKLKWEDFSKHIDLHKFSEFSKALRAFQIALTSKNPKESKSSFHVCLN